jgi:hypothetical protein
MTDDATNPYAAPRIEPEALEAACKASAGPSLQRDLPRHEFLPHPFGLVTIHWASAPVDRFSTSRPGVRSEKPHEFAEPLA